MADQQGDRRSGAAREGRDTRAGAEPAGRGGAAAAAGDEARPAPATTGGSQAARRPAGGGSSPAAGSQSRPSRLAWVAVTVAAALAVWQIVYAVSVPALATDRAELYTSVWLFVSLVLAVGAAVLGIVAVGQRAVPRWPATASLAVGAYVFLVVVAQWIGNLLASSS